MYRTQLRWLATLTVLVGVSWSIDLFVYPALAARYYAESLTLGVAFSHGYNQGKIMGCVALAEAALAWFVAGIVLRRAANATAPEATATKGKE